VFLEEAMKEYQKGLKGTKNFLKTNPEPKIREVCGSAGLTDKETEMIILRFRKGKDRDFASYQLGMSSGRHSVRMTLILNIVKKVLINLGMIDDE
jgi:hypothetical protein